MEPTPHERFARRFGIGCMVAALLAAMLLAVTGAGDAHAAKPQRFWATFRVTKSVGWVEPKWYGHTDCYHRWWTEGRGRQTEVYRSTKPVKALIYTSGLGATSTFIKWRTWDEYDEGSTRQMPGTGRIDRSASRTTDWEAGTCGVRDAIIDDEGRKTYTMPPPKPQDCGARAPAVYGSLYLGSRGAELTISSAGEDQDPLMGIYRTCEFHTPHKLQELRWSSTDVVARIPRKALFDPETPSVTLSATQEASDKDWVGNFRGLLLTSGTVRWSVTLRRAEIPVIRGGKGRRRR